VRRAGVAGGDDHVARPVLGAVAAREPAVAVAADRLDALAEPRREAEPARVVLEVGDDLDPRRIATDPTGEALEGKGRQPLAGVEVQANRNGRASRADDVALLEELEGHAGARQARGGGQPRGARAHDHGVGLDRQ
jgi:hypothetical protein